MLIEWVVDEPSLRLGLGDSVYYEDDADLVFTHPYGPLPTQLVGKPAIINLYGNRKAEAEKWCRCELHKISKWHHSTNTIYVANWGLPRRDLSYRVAEESWFPLELVDELLLAYMELSGTRGFTVWDGFMGRGTVGRSCRCLDLKYVGIDWQPERVKLAREYLGC